MVASISISNNSIQNYKFIYTQLNNFKNCNLILMIQFNITHLFAYNLNGFNYCYSSTI